MSPRWALIGVLWRGVTLFPKTVVYCTRGQIHCGLSVPRVYPPFENEYHAPSTSAIAREKVKQSHIVVVVAVGSSQVAPCLNPIAYGAAVDIRPDGSSEMMGVLVGLFQHTILLRLVGKEERLVCK